MLRHFSQPLNILTLIGVMLVAVNMRPALVSVGPVLPMIGHTLGLNSAGLSLLVSLPVLCFGILAPAGTVVSKRFGIDASLALSLLVLLIGLFVRSVPLLAATLLGTILIGAAIAIMNVLVPAVVKRNFTQHAGLVTGAYITILNVLASVAAGISAPITAALFGSWRFGLVVWAIPTIPALAIWIAPYTDRSHNYQKSDEQVFITPLLKSRRVWQIVGFTTAQSCIYYNTITWLPSVYESYGYTATHAGLVLTVAVAVSVPIALFISMLAGGRESQRKFIVGVAVPALLGLAGIIILPLAAPMLWACLLGISLGGAFPLAVTLFVSRAHNEVETANISMLSQGCAYCVAAISTFALGSLHDVFHNWTAGLVMLMCFAFAEIVLGIGAGRPGYAINTLTK